ncbi:MAG TPA: right-handed parallel beta-helix repeat-containing protein [Mycobacteriales bacterium]|nr:right-handed parallel beta-helix repeat-containing protein [Mycobacteriales bacterium]
MRRFRVHRRRSKVLALAVAGGTLAAAVVGVALAGPGGAGAAPAAGADAESANQAALVAAEDRRLIEIRSVAAVAPLRGGTEYSKPYRLTTGSGYTLVLTSRSAPYTVKDLLTLAPQTFVRQSDGSYLLLENLYLNAGAKLTLSNPGGLTIRMASASTGYVSIVSFGGALAFVGTEQQPVTVTSWDPRTKTPDTTVKDGRAYIRSVGGQFRSEYLQASNLGFWSGRTGGVSLTGTDRPDTGSTEGPESHQTKTERHAGADSRAEGNAGPAQPDQTPAAGDVYAQPSGNLSTPDTRFGTADQSFVSAKISHTTLSGNAYGLFISSADGIEVSDSEVDHSLIDGVILHRFASNGILERITSSDNAGDGFVLARATQEIRISGAVAKNNGNNGISLTGRALAEGPSPSGETVGEYGNNSVANSTFENNKRYGIEVDGGDNVGLQNNEVRGGDMGIVVRRGAQQVSVVGNQVSGQVRQGISVRDAVVNATVTGNTVESSPLGIYLRDSSATIRGNTIDRVTSHGVTAVGDVTGAQVAFNTVSGTGPTPVDTARSHGKIKVEKNQTDAWHDTRSFWIRLRHAAKPMTLLWLGVVLLVLFSAVRARKLGARGTIRHPYEKQRLLDTTDKGQLLRAAPARQREPALVGAGASAPGWDSTGIDQDTQMLSVGARQAASAPGRRSADRVVADRSGADASAPGRRSGDRADADSSVPARRSVDRAVASGPDSSVPGRRSVDRAVADRPPVTGRADARPGLDGDRVTGDLAGRPGGAARAGADRAPAMDARSVDPRPVTNALPAVAPRPAPLPPVDVRPPGGVEARPTWSRPEPAPEWKPRYERTGADPAAGPVDRSVGRPADRLSDLLAERPGARRSAEPQPDLGPGRPGARRATDSQPDLFGAGRTSDPSPERLSDLLAERPVTRREDRTEWLPRTGGALPAPSSDAPNLVIGRTGEPGPAHPSNGLGIPAASPSNGAGRSGHPSSGSGLSGHSSDGSGLSGHPSDGSGLSGHPSNGAGLPVHPSNGHGLPPYEEDATTTLRRPEPAYHEDATTVLPRPRRSAEDGPWQEERP